MLTSGVSVLLLIKESEGAMSAPPQGALEMLRSASVEASHVESAAHCRISFSTLCSRRRNAVNTMPAVNIAMALALNAQRNQANECHGDDLAEGRPRAMSLNGGARRASAPRSSLKSRLSSVSLFSIFIKMLRFFEPCPEGAFASFIVRAG